MLVKDKNSALFFLVLASLLAGGLWRVEVEDQGWAGLKWLNYFHLAIPFSLGLFVLWINLFFKLKGLTKRLFVKSMSY